MTSPENHLEDINREISLTLKETGIFKYHKLGPHWSNMLIHLLLYHLISFSSPLLTTRPKLSSESPQEVLTPTDFMSDEISMTVSVNYNNKA